MLSLSTVSLAACLTDEAETELGTEAQEIIGCPKWGCGENTPNMDTWKFHELHEGGAANLEGISIIEMRKGSNVYHPDVVGAQLFAVAQNGSTLSGAQLINSYLVVDTPSGVFNIHIRNVHNDVTFWVAPGASGAIETYELTYDDPDLANDERPLCANPPSRYAGQGNFWQRPIEAVLFTGDRYDVDAKTVTAASYAAAGNWFNIGCAGSVQAKLHHNRHTTAGATSVHNATQARRQAMLKMYVSDVCNTGHAFTIAGTPLHWTNPAGWMQLTGMEQSKEAFWGPSGALCLETHRLESTFGAQIDATCPSTPTCSSLLPTWPNGWLRGAYILSANP